MTLGDTSGGQTLTGVRDSTGVTHTHTNSHLGNISNTEGSSAGVPFSDIMDEQDKRIEELEKLVAQLIEQLAPELAV